MERSTAMLKLQVNEILFEKLLHGKWGRAGFYGVFHIQKLSIELYQPINRKGAGLACQTGNLPTRQFLGCHPTANLDKLANAAADHAKNKFRCVSLQGFLEEQERIFCMTGCKTIKKLK